MTTFALVDSPIGPLTVVEQDGALVGLYLPDQRHRPVIEGDRDDHALPALQEQLRAYWARELTAFDVPLSLAGTPFQQAVWYRLRTIPYGETWSYGRLAISLGRPTATRAVGLANGRNPVSLVVPCHRVVANNGNLTGYAGGLARKQWLLDLEAGHGRFGMQAG